MGINSADSTKVLFTSGTLNSSLSFTEKYSNTLTLVDGETVLDYPISADEDDTIYFATYVAVDSEYFIKKFNLADSSNEVVKTNSNSPIYLSPERLSVSANSYYMAFNNTIANESLSALTSDLPYTITSKTIMDISCDNGVATADGITFYITDLNIGSTINIDCPSVYPIDVNKMTTMQIQKKTGTGDLIFYLGLKDGRIIKYVANLNSNKMSIEYDYTNNEYKSVKKISCDVSKNTENVLVCHNTMMNQLKLYGNIVSNSITDYFVTQENKIADTSTRIDQIPSAIDSKITSAFSGYTWDDVYLNRYFGSSENSVDDYTSRGSYTFYQQGMTPQDLPLGRTANEIILLYVITGDTRVSKTIVQCLFYTKQEKTFIRYYSDDKGTWSDWQDCNSGDGTWQQNTASQDGYVLAGSGNASKVWKTDSSGNPGWRNETTYSAAGTSLGLVKSGGDVTISSGTITVSDNSHNHIWSNISDHPTSMQNPNALTLTMNGTKSTYTGASTASKTWYAPTSAGTSGQILKSSGSNSAPTWVTADLLTLSTDLSYELV